MEYGVHRVGDGTVVEVGVAGCRPYITADALDDGWRCADEPRDRLRLFAAWPFDRDRLDIDLRRSV
jgi:hypothetical protein